jgi:hypothetical protein
MRCSIGPPIGAWLAIVSVALPLSPARAQTSGSSIKALEMVRTETVPIIDGRLDDAVWATAAVVTDLHQLDPVEYSEPSDRSEFYILYDDDALYVAARMWDSRPDRISANTLRQGAEIGDDDQLILILDPYNNQRDGYQFQVNPNGVRYDGIFVGPSIMQWNWDGIWDAATIRDENGWTVEVVIPFKTLSFNPGSETWGINFGRRLQARNERMAWVSRNRQQTPSISGRAVGIHDINQGMGLDVVPSVSLKQAKDFSIGDDETDFDPSLDIFYKLTPSLSGALTINTDFSATEVDDRQVNLTRFGLFFPEKRDFFLQDADAFEFGGIGSLSNFSFLSRTLEQNARPFFSRRIGLSASGQPVDLNYGTKLSGRAGPWTLGALAIRQDEFETVEPTNLFVGRGAMNVLGESTVGFIVTDGDPRSDLDNSLAGIDFRYLNTRLPSGKTMQAEVWYQQTDTEGLLGEDAAYGLRFRWPNTTGLRFGLGMREIQENFNPAMGFVDRVGIKHYSMELGWLHRYPQTSRIRNLFTLMGYDRTELIGGELQSETLNGRLLSIANQAGDDFRVLLTANREVLLEPFVIWDPDPSSGESPVVIPPGEYSYSAPGINIETQGSREVAGSFTYRKGSFYEGDRENIEGEVTWSPTSQWRLFLSYIYNDIDLPEGSFDLRLAVIGVDFIFSNELSWVNLIQYDNASESAGINSRIHWIPQAGREAYIVLNHALADLDRDNEFHSVNGDLTLKFGYTFRF